MKLKKLIPEDINRESSVKTLREFVSVDEQFLLNIIKAAGKIQDLANGILKHDPKSLRNLDAAWINHRDESVDQMRQLVKGIASEIKKYI